MRRLLVLLLFAVFLTVLPGQANDRPLPTKEAPKAMKVPPGFHVTLFAGEPDVVQPIAFTFDDRGRMWVVECYSYPQWTDRPEGKDRVVILTDKDGDGRFDERKVFWDRGANLSGITLGFGGVWLCATPNLIFVPDRDGDDTPDGPPEVVLDGWNLGSKHNVFNSLMWGPDGWLYGCHGILATANVGKPGTPEKDRVPFNCGVWRYHPIRKVFEPYAWGTTNPWGLDYNEMGDFFITNCVIHHLWHVVQGAHFERMYGEDLRPKVYELIPSIADHIHWGGGHWTSSRGGLGVHDDAGGGHAHSGGMIYLGDNWPDGYRGGIFTCNIHGNRINHDRLDPSGPSYVGKHAPDLLRANDSWFRGIALHAGPDGGVFVSDWSDTGECHNYVEVDRANGRIYKIVHNTVSPHTVDLRRLTDADLIARVTHRNEWQSRQARRLLQERAVAGKLDPATRPSLKKLFEQSSDEASRLRALWALYITGGLDPDMQLALLYHVQPHVRAWGVRLAVDGEPIPAAVLSKLAAMGDKEQSPVVRLSLASALQRLPSAARWTPAAGLATHGEDANDPYLSRMLWYGIEPLVPEESDQAVAFLAGVKIPRVTMLLARRLVELPGRVEERLQPLVVALAKEDDRTRQSAVMRGALQAVSGRRQVPMPRGWETAYSQLSASPSAEVRDLARTLAVLFDDRRALDSLRSEVLDRFADLKARERALQTLVYKQRPEVVELLRSLLKDVALRGAAIRGLGAFSDPTTPSHFLKIYPTLSANERADAVGVLASRPAYALQLLAAVEKGTVPRQDVSAFVVRQLAGLKNKEVDAAVARVWGVVRATSKDRAALVRKYKEQLTPSVLKAADLSRGRVVFARQCGTCHRLFDDGNPIGPELTGSQRASLDYVLENALDPSAVVAREYLVTVLELHNGRVLNGIVRQETEQAVTLQTPNEVVVVPVKEITERSVTRNSMMPEGLFEKMKLEEIRDLVGYLASPTQVPLPPGEAPASPR